MSNEEIITEVDKGLETLKKGLSKMKQALSGANIAVGQAEAYNKGLEDAWKLAKKIAMEKSNGGFDSYEIVNIFGFNDMDAIFMSYTPQEALAKLEAYEKEQNQIKVGDVVFNKDTNEHCVITHIEGKFVVYCLYDDGSCGTSNIKECEKTGKHIDISGILNQISE